MRRHAKEWSGASIVGWKDESVVLVGTLIILLATFSALLPASPAAAKSLYNVIGSGGEAGGQFGVGSGGDIRRGPHGLSVNYTGAGAEADIGDVYVADKRNHRVQQFDAAGRFVRAFGQDVIVNTGTPPNSNGTGYEVCDTTTEPPNTPDQCKAGLAAGTGGAMNEPGAVAIDPEDGSVYVFDAANLRIQKFSSGGAFVWAAGKDVVVGGPATHEVCTVATECKTGVAGSLGGEIGVYSTDVGRDLALDPSTGSLYVTDVGNRRVQEITPAGAFVRAFGWDVYGRNEQQRVTVNATGGTYKLGFEGQETAAIAFNANGAAVAGALAALPAIGAGNIVGTGSASQPKVLTFQALLAGTDVPQITVADASGLTGGTASVAVETIADGTGGPFAGFEECTAAELCKEGIGGAGAGQFGGTAASNSSPNGIAVDATGAIYTVERGVNFRVQKFTPQAGPPALSPSVFAPTVLNGGNASTSPLAIAVDPFSDDVYVAKGFASGDGDPPAAGSEPRVLQLDAAGTEVLDTSMANFKSVRPESAIGSVNGLGFDPQSGLIYVATSSSSFIPPNLTPLEQRVYVFGEVVPPTVRLDSVDVVGQEATVFGAVNPSGGLDATYQVEYSRDGRKWVAVGDAVNVGNGEADVLIEHAVGGLPANSDLSIRIVVTKPLDSARVTSNEISVQVSGAPPAVVTGNAWWNGEGGVALSGQLNPNNANTRYHFQYGPTPSYGSSVPVNLKGTGGLGGDARQVIQQLYSLDGELPLHYRLVATNQFGTTFGLDRVLAPREESWVYELVSDGQSNGLGIELLRGVSDDGMRVALEAQTIGDPTSLPSQWNAFIAEIGPDGWTVPPFGPDPGGGAGTAIGKNLEFSANLDSTVFPQRTTIEAQGQEARFSLSRLDGTSEPASPFLVPVESSGMGTNKGTQFRIQGGSADLSTIVFKKVLDIGTATYVADEPLIAKGYTSVIGLNIYRATGPGENSTLSLVNRDEAGVPMSNVCGAWVGANGANAGGENMGYSLNPVSRDGSVVYFSARPTAPTTGSCAPASHPLRLYKRVDDSSTVAISESRCDREAPDPACSSFNGDDVFQGASADGSKVLFSSSRQLTDSDLDQPANAFQGCAKLLPVGCDLYLFDSDPSGGEPSLTQISVGEETAAHPVIGAGAEVLGVVDVSADGSRVYFVAKGQLTQEAVAGGNNLFVYERSEEYPDGRLGYIASLSASDSGLWPEGSFPVSRQRAAVFPSSGGDGDGHVLFFNSVARLDDDDEDSVADVYRWNDQAEELTCISCDGSQEIGTAPILGKADPTSPFRQQSVRMASDDGEAAVFVTEEAILPGDENAVADVYLWRDGEGLSLVTGGTGASGVPSESVSEPTPSRPLISPDGERVFFVTKAKLHPADENSAVDAYAVTVGGGFPLPAPGSSRCEDGQSCRGDAPPPSPVGPPATSTFQGAGNPVPATPPCGRGKVRRGGKCVPKVALAKRRCAKLTGKAKSRCVRKQLRRINRSENRNRSVKRANNEAGGKR